MSFTEAMRHDLFTWFEEAMGPERAANFMSLLPPVGWADVATKHDLHQMERHIELSIRASVSESLDRQTKVFVGWLLTSQAAVLGAAIGVTALLS